MSLWLCKYISVACIFEVNMLIYKDWSFRHPSRQTICKTSKLDFFHSALFCWGLDDAVQISLSLFSLLPSFLLYISFFHSLERYFSQMLDRKYFWIKHYLAVLDDSLSLLLPSSFTPSFLYITIKYESVLKLIVPCNPYYSLQASFPPPFSLAVSQPLNTFQFQMKITIRFYYYETSSCTDKNLIIQNKASMISLTMRLSCSFFIFFLENINDLQGESVFQLLSFSSFSYFF